MSFYTAIKMADDPVEALQKCQRGLTPDILHIVKQLHAVDVSSNDLLPLTETFAD